MDFPLTSSRFQLKYLGASLGFSFLFYLMGIGAPTAALMCFAIAVLSSFSYSGLEITVDHTKTRDYVDILNWRIGKWRPMPIVTGVTVKYFSALQIGTPANMSWGTWRNSSRRLEEIVIMLSIQNSRQGIIIGRTDINHIKQALSTVQQVADAFSVPINTYLPNYLQSQE